MESWQIELEAVSKAAGFSPEIDRFFFLRHGQTDSNLRHIVQGSIDNPLNRNGEEQAVSAAKVLVGHGITEIITSPLQRARRTAEIASAAIGASITKLDPRFKERDFGAYENELDPMTVWARSDRGVEPAADFAQRVVAGVNEALTMRCGIPLIVAHGGVRRILLFATGLKVPPEAELNGVPMEFVRRNGAWQVFPVLTEASQIPTGPMAESRACPALKMS